MDSREVEMIRWWKAMVAAGVVAGGLLLAGCPGMPGAPGGGGAEQRTPPGVLPPPGIESGGVRTLMGSTITAPDNSYLLVRFSGPQGEATGAETKWQTCRRVSVLENCALIEGLNYDGRDEAAPRDANKLLAYSNLGSLEWKYEARPAPPAQEPAKAEPKGNKKGR